MFSLTDTQTGQLHPSVISHDLDSSSSPEGNRIITSRLDIRRGLAAIVFSTLPDIPVTSRFLESARIATIVIMQVSIEVASKSVGEKDSPLPLLSTGASVISCLPEGL